MKSTSPVLMILAIALIGACKPAPPAAIDDGLAANMTAPHDYYMNGMRMTRFTADGTLAYRLNASRITHYPAGDRAVLDTPVLSWRSEDGTPWLLSSQKGDLHASSATGEDELLLEENVIVVSSPVSDPPIRIATEALTVQTLSRIAGTQAAVSVTTPGTDIRSIGMELRLEDNHIRLLNQVRGSHEP